MSSELNGRRMARPVDAPARVQPKQATSELLTLRDICAILSVSKSTVERMIRSEPTFPQPRRFRKGRLIRFFADEVQAYLMALPRAEYDDHAFDPNDNPEGA